MSNIKVTRDTDGEGRLRVSIAGVIDEETDFADVLAFADNNTVLDLGGIQRVNSIGLHRWIGMVKLLTDSRRITIAACPYALAIQAGYVANLFAAAPIESCLAPYHCGTCRVDQMVLVSRAEVHAAQGPPEKRCGSCETLLRFEELDSYFGFLLEGESV